MRYKSHTDNNKFSPASQSVFENEMMREVNDLMLIISKTPWRIKGNTGIRGLKAGNHMNRNLRR